MSGQPHAAVAASRPLGLLSLNTGGLSSSPAKRRDLFSQLLGRPAWSIVCGQESHHANGAVAAGWAKEGAGPGMPWLGHQFWHHKPDGGSRSCGVFVLFHHLADVQAARLGYQDAAGRLLRVDFTYAGRDMAVLCVYAPCDQSERKLFLATALDAALEGAPACVLLGGDFNCVVDLEEDQVGGGSSSGRLEGSVQLQRVMLLQGLYDVWREQHPGQRQFTHTLASDGASRARLDRWLVSEGLKPWVDSAGHHIGLPGDHSAVTLVLRPPGLPALGPGPWRLRPSLLNSAAFQDAVRAAVAEYLAGAASHANSGSSGSNGGSSGSDSHRLVWEGLKRHLKMVAMDFAAEERRQHSAAERSLRSALRRAQRDIALGDVGPGSLQAERHFVGRLRELLAARSEAAYQAASALWQLFGERPTAWFYSLGRPRLADSAPLTHVRDASGT
jgi:exonuclease III